MWPGFKSRRRCHMWVEFVVGSLPCSERFFSGYSGFPLSSKANISKFQFDQESGRRRTTMWMCYLQIVILFSFHSSNFLRVNNIAKFADTRQPDLCIFKGINKLVILAAVIICFPPEKPRDIALIYPVINPRACEKMVAAVNKVYKGILVYILFASFEHMLFII